MARNRTISPDFWTWEAVIDCPPMTRLLFIGLWNFADDFGVQPLRPRTIRMQVFPGDTMQNDNVCAMIDELAARGLVRLYTVDGQEYVAIVEWDQLQRVGKRARRRYPPVPGASEADETLSAAASTPDDRKPVQTPSADLGGETGIEPEDQPQSDPSSSAQRTLALTCEGQSVHCAALAGSHAESNDPRGPAVTFSGTA